MLQDVWAQRRYDPRAIRLVTGERLDVIHAGRHNSDAGPDFLDARLALTDEAGRTMVLAGDVEIHRTSGEWILHRHDADSRYDRVVLHVGFGEDRHTGKLKRSDGTLLPEVILGAHVTTPLRRLLYDFFAHPRPDFPCAASWPSVPPEVIRDWVRSLGLDRLRKRVDRLSAHASAPHALHVALFRALGYAPNAQPMAELARRVPWSVLTALTDPIDREAALLGTAGLIPEPDSLRQQDPPAAEYAGLIAQRFTALRTTIPHPPMSPTAWSAARLRPANQPVLRVAQAAALASRDALGGVDAVVSLIDIALGEAPVRSLRALLLNVQPSEFWTDHVRFQTRVPPGSGRLGVDRADRLIVDAIIPALAVHVRRNRDGARERRLLEVVGLFPASTDSVTRRYDPFRPAGEVEAAGLRTLASEYCAAGRCLECDVGRHLLGR